MQFGPDHAHAVAAHDLDELAARAAAPSVAHFAKPGGDDDEASHAGLAALLGDVEHVFLRHDDDREVDGIRHSSRCRDTPEPSTPAMAVRVHRIDGAGESVRDEIRGI